jgi:hypothetical protein
VDNSVTSWAPRPALVALGFAAALAAAAGAVLDDDKRAVVLFVIAAVVLVALAAYGLFLRPRLSADEHGLRVRTIGGTHRLPWSHAQTQLRTTKRLGRETTTLEISADEQLFVFGWLELGEDPRDVLDVLSSMRR